MIFLAHCQIHSTKQMFCAEPCKH